MKRVFKEKSLKACYFAGLLAADGYIRKDKPIIRLVLKTDDQYILEELSSFLKAKGNVRVVKKYQDVYFSEFSMYSKQHVEDLKTYFNITSRKTLTLKFPKNLNNKQALSFIKGYFDGDGSFIRVNRKKNHIPTYVFSIVGTKNLLKWIKLNLAPDSKVKIYKHSISPVYYLVVGGNFQVREIISKLIKVKTPELKRKWNKIRKHFKLLNNNSFHKFGMDKMGRVSVNKKQQSRLLDVA